MAIYEAQSKAGISDVVRVLKGSIYGRQHAEHGAIVQDFKIKMRPKGLTLKRYYLLSCLTCRDMAKEKREGWVTSGQFETARRSLINLDF